MVFLVPIIALIFFMSCLFFVALLRKNNGMADVGYGTAFIILTFVTATIVPSVLWYMYILIALVFIWGIRLSIRIYLKNYGKPEDFRYKAWRDTWGKYFLVRSFFQIYMLQGFIIFLVALPVLLSLLYPTVNPTLAYVYAGVCLWILGFLFESIADYELDTFIKNPENRGKIMTTGLWRYSRHPNYFGESLMWWGLGVAGFAITHSLLVFISPILITFLLLKVSGVPMLERRFEGNPDWEEYKIKTSVFIPLPPKKT